MGRLSRVRQTVRSGNIKDQQGRTAAAAKFTGEKPSALLYLGVSMVALLKDLLDFVGVGSLPAIGTVVTLCFTFLIWMLLSLFDRSSQHTRSNMHLMRGLVVIGFGLVEAVGFGLNFLPIETTMVIVLYQLVNHAWKEEEKKAKKEGRPSKMQLRRERSEEARQARAEERAAQQETVTSPMSAISQTPPLSRPPMMAGQGMAPSQPQRTMSDMHLPQDAVVSREQPGTGGVIASSPRVMNVPQMSQEWNPNGGVPPPMTPEYGVPQSEVPSWDPNSGTPPSMTSKYMVQPSFSGAYAPPVPAPSPIEAANPSEQSWPGKDLGFPPPLTPEFGIPPPLPVATLGNVSAMKERTLETSELLNKKEASKKFLAEERKKLAEEIREQRNRLSTMNTAIESAIVSLESAAGESGDKQFGQLLELQSIEASAIANRVSRSSELSKQDVQGEQENISQLIANSEGIGLIKARLKEHYEKADAIAKEKFENMQKTVEHTALRNGAFFVHTIQEREGLRHNELSNVANETTYEDDVDVLLSLEPTISASSIFSGRSKEGNVSGLWSDTGGFLIGGGDIRYADRNDLDSKSVGIKERTVAKGYEKQSIADIDKAVSKRGESETMITRDRGTREAGTTYNEFIVENPKIFGYFQPVGVEEDELYADGKYWAGDVSTKYDYEELAHIKKKLEKFQADPTLVSEYTRETPELYQEKLNKFQQKIDRYKERFGQMKSRGNPLYIMTPDRQVYEYEGINEDGSVKVGIQLTPEEVATGRAGLSVEKRKEIGEKILEKRLFKQQETHEEARKIIDRL